MITRNEAVELVGEHNVSKVEALNCDFSHRIMEDPNDILFSAHLDCLDLEGDDVSLSVYYIQSSSDLNECEGNFDWLKWIPAGYTVDDL